MKSLYSIKNRDPWGALCILNIHQNFSRNLESSSVYSYRRRRLNAALTRWCYENRRVSVSSMELRP